MRQIHLFFQKNKYIFFKRKENYLENCEKNRIEHDCKIHEYNDEKS